MLKVKENINEGIERLVKESFYFEKTKEPVDVAAIYFIDQNFKLSPGKFLSNTKENLVNISSIPKKNNHKIDGYFLPNNNELYSEKNAKYVDFITTSIVEASIDAHQTENFIFYDNKDDYPQKKYFYDLLNKKILEKNKNNLDLINYYFTRLETFAKNNNSEEIEAFVVSCIDPNLLEKFLNKIESSYNLDNYLLNSIPAGGYVFTREEMMMPLIKLIKNTKGFTTKTKLIICSHGPKNEDNEKNCYNCGGYQIFENLKGAKAYEKAKNDLILAKEILKNNGITNVDTVMNTTKFVSANDDSKRYKATFEIV